MQSNLTVFIYCCSLVFLLGIVKSESGDETLQYYEASEQNTRNDELADASYANSFLDDRNKRSSNAFANSLAKSGSDSGELMSNGYLYGRPSSASADSHAYANNFGDLYGNSASSANAQASALSNDYGYAPKVPVIRRPVVTSIGRVPSTVTVIPYTVGGGGYSSASSDAASNLYGSSSNANSVAQSGSYGSNGIDLGSLWSGLEAPVSYNYGNALSNANSFGYERSSSSNAISKALASSQGYQSYSVPSFVSTPRYVSTPAPYAMSPSGANTYAGANSYANGNGYSSSNANAEASSSGNTLSLLGNLGAGNWDVYEVPAPSSSYAAADAAVNGYGDAQAKAIAQALGRRFLGGLGGSLKGVFGSSGGSKANAEANAYSSSMSPQARPAYPSVYPQVYQSAYPQIYPQVYPSVYATTNTYPLYRPTYSGVENAYPVLPGIVSPRKPKVILNADAVAQKDGTLKAVIEAILEARRRSGNTV